MTQYVQDASFKLTARYFQIARWLYAPNQELIDQLAPPLGSLAFPWRAAWTRPHSVPRTAIVKIREDRRRLRWPSDCRKECSRLRRAGTRIKAAGLTNFEIAFVGQGSEQDWLRENVPNAVMAGVLKGRELSRAYANFDIFAFPSQTDTFGNVVLEALASGVPAVVTSGGGPKFIVHDSKTGFVASDRQNFFRGPCKVGH